MRQRQEPDGQRYENTKSSTHLLRGLTDSAPADGCGMVHLFDTWARLRQLAPDPDHAVGYLAQLNGLYHEQVEHMRQVRNCCAHTVNGWPSTDDLTQAFGTAYALSELTRDIRLIPVQQHQGQADQAGIRGRSKLNRLRALTDHAPKEPQEGMGVVRVMDTWARLLKNAPDKKRVVTYVVQVSGLRFDDVDHLRQIRICCAHPDDGWPSSEDLTQAFRTAYALGEVVLGRLRLR